MSPLIRQPVSGLLTVSDFESKSPNAEAEPTTPVQASDDDGLLSTRNMLAAGIAGVVALAVAVPVLVNRRRKA
ncbi:hypothetical protein ACMATS_23485 [Streptoverticillium reticulum]|uniref:hypothetical protein n=1 Tax=Streptoverticillium reticulum TaxID=1433415 RepID=UPI0039BF8341